MATGMRYEDVDVEEDGAWLVRSRPLMQLASRVPFGAEAATSASERYG